MSATPLRLARAGVLLAALLALGAPIARADVARTLVVRGRVLAADGSPLAGAHVSARGTVTLATLTDDRGHYTLSAPFGTLAALRRGAFTLEVRAEQDGHRLPLASGAPGLGIEIALVPANGHVRVRSNAQAATSAITGALAQPDLATLWVDADFGGAVRPSGGIVLGAVDELDPQGRPIAVHVSPPARETSRIAPPPAQEAPRVAPPPAHEPPRVAPSPAASASDSVQRSTPATPSPQRVTVPVTLVPVTPPPAATSPRAAPPPAPTGERPGHPSAWVAAPRASTPPAPQLAPASPPPAAPPAVHTPRSRSGSKRGAHTRSAGGTVTGSAVEAPPAAGAASPTASPPGPAHVKPVEPFSPPPASPAEPDTCACRLRGTVEIDWDRPLERDFPVELSLEGPAAQRGEVQMFIGSPREFRFGPLPCGNYRLVVRPQGRIRYTVVRGDSVVRVRCEGGLTQVRVHLEPHGH